MFLDFIFGQGFIQIILTLNGNGFFYYFFFEIHTDIGTKTQEAKLVFKGYRVY